MSKKKTQAMINREKYLAEGKKIPTCVNPGCQKNVIVRDWKYYSFKHQCGDCTSRQQKNLPLHLLKIFREVPCKLSAVSVRPPKAQLKETQENRILNRQNRNIYQTLKLRHLLSIIT
mgnify:CR=1 FL=1